MSNETFTYSILINNTNNNNMNSFLMSSKSDNEFESKRILNGFITETKLIVDENKI